MLFGVLLLTLGVSLCCDSEKARVGVSFVEVFLDFGVPRSLEAIALWRSVVALLLLGCRGGRLVLRFTGV